MQQTDKMDVVVIDSPNSDVPVIEEALTALDLVPSSFSSLETGMATTYLVAESPADAEALAKRLEGYLADWQEMLSAPPVFSVKAMRQEDWANSWKKNFHTFRASERLVVKPSWEDYAQLAGDIVVPIDPGMCFGTGYHGTTKACLKYLDQLQSKHGALSFIDAGTGSGILSIGARLLGYSPVVAFDNDPQCITTALENLERAGFTDVPITCAPLGEFVPEKKADVVAANILAVVLLAQSDAVVDLVRPGGYLILSGILTEQYPAIYEAFTARGCTELNRITIDEWTSGLYQYNEG